MHPNNLTTLLVDVTPVGLPREVLPPEGQPYALSALHFQSWKAAEQFLLKMGADPEELRKTSQVIKATSLAVLTILD